MWFLQTNAFLKLENIHNFATYFHPLRNIVLKLFNDKYKAKACEFNTIILDGLIFKKLHFFMRQMCPSLNDKM